MCVRCGGRSRRRGVAPLLLLSLCGVVSRPLGLLLLLHLLRRVRHRPSPRALLSTEGLLIGVETGTRTLSAAAVFKLHEERGYGRFSSGDGVRLSGDRQAPGDPVRGIVPIHLQVRP